MLFTSIADRQDVTELGDLTQPHVVVRARACWILPGSTKGAIPSERMAIEYRPWDTAVDADFTCHQLVEAMKELREINEDASEEGYPLPAPYAVSNARILLEVMFNELPRRYFVYSTQDSEVAISYRSSILGCGLLVLCRPDDGVQIIGIMKNESTSELFPDALTGETKAHLTELLRQFKNRERFS